jgi:hypothetical protein
MGGEEGRLEMVVKEEVVVKEEMVVVAKGKLLKSALPRRAHERSTAIRAERVHLLE